MTEVFLNGGQSTQGVNVRSTHWEILYLYSYYLFLKMKKDWPSEMSSHDICEILNTNVICRWWCAGKWPSEEALICKACPSAQCKYSSTADSSLLTWCHRRWSWEELGPFSSREPVWPAAAPCWEREQTHSFWSQTLGEIPAPLYTPRPGSASLVFPQLPLYKMEIIIPTTAH